jgi:hypothetical protein
MPDFVTAAMDKEEQRKLSRARASNDTDTGGRIFFKLLSPQYPGKIGDRELDAEDERRRKEKEEKWNLDVPPLGLRFRAPDRGWLGESVSLG